MIKTIGVRLFEYMAVGVIIFLLTVVIVLLLSAVYTLIAIGSATMYAYLGVSDPKDMANITAISFFGCLFVGALLVEMVRAS